MSLGTAVIVAVGCGPDTFSDRDDPNEPPETVDDQCVPEGTTCAVAFEIALNGSQAAELRGSFAADGWEVGIPMQVEGAVWRTELELAHGARVQYKFVLDGTDWVNDPLNPETETDGLGGDNSVLTVDCGFTICDPEVIEPPIMGSFDWRSAVLYFVFVDRFNNGDTSNDFVVDGVETQSNYQGGDFAGVIAKIEDGYFESLGVNALWLSVPMDNPNTPGMGTDGHLYTGYHAYWPSDLEAVEEHFGTLETLKQLVDTAHARGIKVVLDYAMNHVHADSTLFSSNPDWFWPLDYNGAQCVCGQGCDWNDSYEQKRCWFTDYLPDWNFTNQAARAFSVNNAVEWITKTGADGFRLDAVKHIELDWLLDLRTRIAAEIEPMTGERFYMVGETFESGDRDIIKSFVGPDRLDGQFDFPLRAVLVDTILRRSGTMNDLDAFLSTNDGYYPGIMSTFIGNHDIARIIHTALDQPWGAWDNGDPWNAPPPLPDTAAPFERVGLGFSFLFTTKGVPLVYYGDEIGLPGAGDPDNRRFMQWDGYTDNQQALQAHLQKLGTIRRDHPALWRGGRQTTYVDNDVFAYVMTDSQTQDTVYVALNRADTAGSVENLPSQGIDLLTGAQIAGPTASIPPRSALIISPE